MKRALAMALGAMLVASSAAPAAAASQIDFSGYYRTYFQNDYRFPTPDSFGDPIYGSNFASDLERKTDSYFINRLNLDVAFHATDEISVYWQLRAPSSQYWGQGNGNRTAVETNYVYGQIKQDWGTIDIGKLPEGHTNIGLMTLGWAPGGPDPVAYTWVNPFDFDTAYDGIRYSNRWDNGFQLVAQYNRLNYAGRTDNGIIQQYGANDLNADLFLLEPAYFWDGGGASFALGYLRDATDKPWGAGIGLEASHDWFINPAFSQTWGDFSFHFEGKYAWGEQDSVNTAGHTVTDKSDGLGVYLDFDYNYGPGNINLAGWWTRGTGANDSKLHSDVDMGVFYPLLVAYNGNVSGWGRYSNNMITVANEVAAPGGAFVQGDANHWAIDFSGNHAFTDDISLSYAVAYLALNKTREHAKKDIGVETDLGLQVQLLDNLQFTTSVGYLFTGKAFDGYTGSNIPVDYKAKDAYTWYSTLTFSF